jgi:LysM repeat protein
MSLTYSQVVLLSVVLAPASLLAAPSQESLSREYEQVRKIALRDPKVRAAYAAADQKLDEKIVKIDPTLAGYVKSRGSAAPASAEKPTATATAKPAPAKPATQTRHDISHVVVKGDTLSSIAAKYHVNIADIRKANHIQDERKLPVGQTLTIPKAPAAGTGR